MIENESVENEIVIFLFEFENETLRFVLSMSWTLDLEPQLSTYHLKPSIQSKTLLSCQKNIFLLPQKRQLYPT